jgi:hypothetical protein
MTNVSPRGTYLEGGLNVGLPTLCPAVRRQSPSVAEGQDGKQTTDKSICDWSSLHMTEGFACSFNLGYMSTYVLKEAMLSIGRFLGRYSLRHLRDL